MNRTISTLDAAFVSNTYAIGHNTVMPAIGLFGERIIESVQY